MTLQRDDKKTVTFTTRHAVEVIVMIINVIPLQVVIKTWIRIYTKWSGGAVSQNGGCGIEYA